MESFQESRMYSEVPDMLVTLTISLFPLFTFEFRGGVQKPIPIKKNIISGEGNNRNFSNWMDWDQVLELCSVTLRNSNGSMSPHDRVAIVAKCLRAASGILFRIVVVPKSLGNFLLMVNVIPGILEPLHERCR